MGDPYVEILDKRTLFAAAPPTLIGLSFTVNITKGSAPFASSGYYTVNIHSTGRSYDLEGGPGVADSSGTGIYTAGKSGAAELVGDDVLLGRVIVDFNFITPTSGDVVLKGDGSSQSGVFQLTGPNFASLSSGVLTVTGTSDGDAISGALVGGKLIVTRNNITQKFVASSVNRIVVSAGAGNDVVDFSSVATPIYVDAGDGNDLVYGGTANDTLTGGAGKNTLNGGDGDDRLNGSGAPDLLFGDAGDDRLYGNGGNDTLDGGGGVDRLFGGDGNDSLLGGSSNDKLYGEAGNDTLNGQGQSDLCDGGDGTDTAIRDSLDTDVSIETLVT